MIEEDRYVIRLGGYYLQGDNGWGSRSCARTFQERELKKWLQIFPWARAEPAAAHISESG